MKLPVEQIQLMIEPVKFNKSEPGKNQLCMDDNTQNTQEVLKANHNIKKKRLNKILESVEDFESIMDSEVDKALWASHLAKSCEILNLFCAVSNSNIYWMHLREAIKLR